MSTKADSDLVLEQIKDFCHLYIGVEENRDLERILTCLGDELTIIGTGKHEFFQTKEEFLSNLLSCGYEEESLRFDILHEEYHAVNVVSDVWTVYGKIHVKEKNIYNHPLVIDMDTRFSIICRLVDGQCRLSHIHHSIPYSDQEDGEFYPKLIMDTANRAIEYSHHLEKLVEQDAMTQLFNRTAIENKVDQFLQSHEGSFAFLMLDVDNFKNINDTFGHPFGDRILMDVASVLRKVYPSDAYLARTGGDEFALFLTGDFPDDVVEAQAQRLLDGFRSLSLRHNCQVGCSIGITRSTPRLCSFSKLFAVVDKALYKSKLTGKSKYTFYKNADSDLEECT